jgi:hypothetical protein
METIDTSLKAEASSADGGGADRSHDAANMREEYAKAT